MPSRSKRSTTIMQKINYNKNILSKNNNQLNNDQLNKKKNINQINIVKWDNNPLQNPLQNRKKRWTIIDINILLQGIKSKKSYDQIAEKLRRTPLSAELKFHKYVLHNCLDKQKLQNETGMSVPELETLIKNINEKNEIYNYIKEKNLRDMPYENVKRLYLYEKRLPMMRNLLEFVSVKKELLDYMSDEELNSVNYYNFQDYSTNNLLILKKMLEYQKLKKELCNNLNDNLLSERDYQSIDLI